MRCQGSSVTCAFQGLFPILLLVGLLLPAHAQGPMKIVVPPSPPPARLMAAVRQAASPGDVMLSNVPAFSWVYGCSPTAAGMLAGYYDLRGYGNLYAGPGNGGACPLSNDTVWGAGECPFVASHLGKDSRTTRAHVDDYWGEPDPSVTNSWPVHTDDCLADYMGTSQDRYNNTVDGSTTFWYWLDGSPMYDYNPTSGRDGCHGIRLYLESRGYPVLTNYTQLIYNAASAPQGCTFAQYCAEINNGYPVIIQVSGHTMLGIGYNPSGNVVYLHDTWGNYTTSMTWGGSYQNMQQWGVTVVHLGPIPANQPPVAQDQQVTATEDTVKAITLVATDPNADPLTFTVVTAPAHGTLAGTAPNLTYTPAANYNGADSFTCKANDGKVDSNTATVSISVTPVNDAPAAKSDGYGVKQNAVLTVAAPGVLANDADVDGNTLTAVLVRAPYNGVLSLNANGAFTYTPNAGFSGSDSFTYKDYDGGLYSGVVSVAIAVSAVATPPTVVNDAYATAMNTPLAVNAPGVLANDSDPNKLPLTAKPVSGPSHGTLSLNANGSFVYTPVSSYAGPDSFTYKANNGKADSAAATVTITVTGTTNLAPAAKSDGYGTKANATLTVAAPGVLANDADPNGDPLTAVLVRAPYNGVLVLSANGAVTYTPNAGYVGTDTFTYKAFDGALYSGVVSVAIAVRAQ